LVAQARGHRRAHAAEADYADGGHSHPTARQPSPLLDHSWSQRVVDRNGRKTLKEIVLSRARSAAFGGRRPLIGQFLSKKKLAVAIDSFL
jgi:hypothetical protein